MAAKRAKRVRGAVLKPIVHSRPEVKWIAVSDGHPPYNRPVWVTDGVELAHCAREMSDRDGEHYMLVDEGSEFTNVTHWCEEPLLPNGKPPKVKR